MQAKGHWGLALLILSLFAIPFGISIYIIGLIFLTALLSSLPNMVKKLLADYGLEWQEVERRVVLPDDWQRTLKDF